MPTQRYKLTIAYRGTRYHGWQIQPMLDNFRGEPPPPGQGLPTIQEVVGRAIVSIVHHPINLVGSSRTDAGVHAKGQIAHFDTDQAQIPIEGMRRAANHALPDDILIRTIEPAPDSFDAILSTTSKRYQYAIWHTPDRPPFFNDLVWHRWQELDVAAMRAAAARFVGEHDFASFARPRHGRESAIRTVLGCEISYRPPRLIIGIEGTGFLWHMVRIMVGTMVEIGLGRYGPERIDEMLAATDRRAAGPTAPPHGLYLQWIKTVAGHAPSSPRPVLRERVRALFQRPDESFGSSSPRLRRPRRLPQWVRVSMVTLASLNILCAIPLCALGVRTLISRDAAGSRAIGAAFLLIAALLLLAAAAVLGRRPDRWRISTYSLRAVSAAALLLGGVGIYPVIYLQLVSDVHTGDVIVAFMGGMLATLAGIIGALATGGLILLTDPRVKQSFALDSTIRNPRLRRAAIAMYALLCAIVSIGVIYFGRAFFSV